MEKKAIHIFFILTLALVSCTEKVQEKPKVIYKEKEVVTNEVKPDSTIIKVSDLPVYMEGTKYLIFPVGDIRVYDTGKYSSYGNSKTNAVSYAISNYNRYEITGDFDNLKFQHIDSTKIHSLTQQVLKIQTVTYLESFAAKTQNGILIYTIADADTNADGRIDANDIKSLYISKIDGSNFKKLTKNYQELIDWNVVDSIKRLYFRSIEDINKNGAFDKDDKLHYQYVNLLDTNWEVSEYDPVHNLSANQFAEKNTTPETEITEP